MLLFLFLGAGVGFYYIDMSEHFQGGFHFALVNDEHITPELLNECYSKHQWLTGFESGLNTENPNFYQNTNPVEYDQASVGLKGLLDSFKNPNARGFGQWLDVVRGQANYWRQIQRYLGLSTIAQEFESKVSQRFRQLGQSVGGRGYEGYKYRSAASNQILAPIYTVGCTNGKSDNLRNIEPELITKVKTILSKLGYKEQFVHDFEKAYAREFDSVGFFHRNPFSTMRLKLFFNAPIREELEAYAAKYPQSRTARVLARMQNQAADVESSNPLNSGLR